MNPPLSLPLKPGLIALPWVVFFTTTYLQCALLDCTPDSDLSIIWWALPVSVCGCVCKRPVFAWCQREMWQTVNAQVGFHQACPIDTGRQEASVVVFSTRLPHTLADNKRTRNKNYMCSKMVSFRSLCFRNTSLPVIRTCLGSVLDYASC